MLQMLMSAGPTTPVIAVGKHGASAVTLSPRVRFGALSRNTMDPEVVSLAVKLLTELPWSPPGRKIPMAATTPKLLPTIELNPAAASLTEPLVEVKRTVLAEPACTSSITI